MSREPSLAGRWRRRVPLGAAIAALLLLLAGLFVILQNDRGYLEQKRSEAGVQAGILAESVVAALDFRDAEAAGDAVDALKVNPQIQAAVVYDARGELFAGYERAPGILPARLDAPLADDDDLVLSTAPVAMDGTRIGTVRTATVREPLSRRVTRYGLIALLVVMAALVVGVLGIAHAALTKANRQLKERAVALRHANSELQVQMEERARAEEQLRQAQKMQALGQLTGGIAHDFNNLLTVIQGSADILQRPKLPEEKRIRFADAIAQTAARAAGLTKQLLAFARRQPLKPEIIDLNRHISGMLDLLDRTLGAQVDIRADLADGLCATEVDPSQLENAILNVAVNARDAMPDGGTLTIRTELLDAGAARLEGGGAALALSVADTGTGIEPAAMDRIFEPFFTTKAVGKGTGLGLSQVYGFATQSGGDVRVASEPGSGTTVTILLPCSSQAAQDERASAAPARRGSLRTGRVLVVDDNEEVGAFAEALLKEIGHSVIRAASAEEAIGLLHPGRFDLVFTDVVMPGMSGLDLAEHIRQRQPDLPVILTTGYSDRISSSGSGGFPVVHKPYNLPTLEEAVDQALAKG